ncbi:type II secretion system F family protein [Pseudotabrizicola sediminis]|uniref:Type II secretion system F family protein n=1 Tax=Pseudotabrizicola sediminis TaxID=2486418 RepID=A0ABY2KRJ3_9RHOB|nr:type II secretion system F family protein [Pseudotabrizicola sediminis]TGD45333.1 type II secretion system F family protein [Pseudotabrizicola sediminis]
MFEALATHLQTAGLTPQMLIILGAGIGAMLVVFGLSGTLAGRDPVLRRMAAQGRRRPMVEDRGLLRYKSADPKGMMKTLIPADRKQRSEVERQLALAGFTGPHSVRNYYLLRLGLGIVLPTVLLALIWATRAGIVVLPQALDTRIGGWSQLHVFQILSALVAIGFFGPSIGLRSRVQERRRAIEESFPNALDLIQISVEAGLGFDASMIRVGNELEKTAPGIAEEMLAAQREIQAGKSRDRALLDMAARTGVDEVTAFANVVLQSMQFGTSISETLTTHASEMRRNREFCAQEMANKLPVKMSVVMASLMLPALLLLTLGPVVIRYLRFFAG